MSLNTHQRTVLRRCPPDRAFKAREVGCGEEHSLAVFVRTGLARREPATEVRGGSRLQFQFRLTEAGRAERLERVAIVGSRHWPHAVRIRQLVAALPAGTVVVSGGADGVDRIAATAARARGLAVREHRPDYRRFGRAAPLVRNQQIVAGADRLVAFWDGQSRGTAHAIECARRRGLPIELILVAEEVLP